MGVADRQGQGIGGIIRFWDLSSPSMERVISITWALTALPYPTTDCFTCMGCIHTPARASSAARRITPGLRQGDAGGLVVGENSCSMLSAAGWYRSKRAHISSKITSRRSSKGVGLGGNGAVGDGGKPAPVVIYHPIPYDGIAGSIPKTIIVPHSAGRMPEKKHGLFPLRRKPRNLWFPRQFSMGIPCGHYSTNVRSPQVPPPTNQLLPVETIRFSPTKFLYIGELFCINRESWNNACILGKDKL